MFWWLLLGRGIRQFMIRISKRSLEVLVSSTALLTSIITHLFRHSQLISVSSYLNYLKWKRSQEIGRTNAFIFCSIRCLVKSISGLISVFIQAFFHIFSYLNHFSKRYNSFTEYLHYFTNFTDFFTEHLYNGWWKKVSLIWPFSIRWGHYMATSMVYELKDRGYDGDRYIICKRQDSKNWFILKQDSYQGMLRIKLSKWRFLIKKRLRCIHFCAKLLLVGVSMKETFVNILISMAHGMIVLLEVMKDHGVKNIVSLRLLLPGRTRSIFTGGWSN